MLVQRSFQSQPFPALRVADGEVVLAVAGHLEAGILQGGDHVGAVLHPAALDPLQEVVPDQLPRAGFHFEAGPEPRRLDVGAVARLLRLGPRRIVGAAPAVLVVEGVAQRVERLLPSGRRDVQAAARLEVAARGEDVHVHAVAVLPVQDRRPGVAVLLQPRPGRLLELVEEGPDLGVGGLVLRRPRDHERGVPVLEPERVRDGGHVVRVAAQDLDARPHQSGGVSFADEIVGGGLGGAFAAAGAANEHRRPRRRTGRPRAATARTRLGWRSR